MLLETLECSGLYPAIMSMRNPMNSWGLGDTKIDNGITTIGEKDLKLAQTLIKAGTEHSKFMRMIQVWANMNMTLYFWSEFDTYKYNTKNSCSTMHKLLNVKNEISLDMFEYYEEDTDIVQAVVDRLNEIREEFLVTKDIELKRRAKCLLFTGFLQLRTVNTNYAELRNIVLQRKNHQLVEDWQKCFCKWVTTLPYAKELIFYGIEKDFNRLQNL